MEVFGSQEPRLCFFLKELCASVLRIMEMLTSEFWILNSALRSQPPAP